MNSSDWLMPSPGTPINHQAFSTAATNRPRHVSTATSRSGSAAFSAARSRQVMSTWAPACESQRLEPWEESKKGYKNPLHPFAPAQVYVQKHPCNEVLQVVTSWRDPIFETFEAADISYCCLILPMSFLYENKRTVLGFEVDIPASSMGHGSCVFIPSISWTCIRHCYANWCSSPPLFLIHSSFGQKEYGHPHLKHSPE